MSVHKFATVDDLAPWFVEMEAPMAAFRRIRARVMQESEEYRLPVRSIEATVAGDYVMVTAVFPGPHELVVEQCIS